MPDSPGVKPAKGKPGKAASIAQELTTLVRYRVSKIAGAAIGSWLAGLGLGAYHLSVPFAATTLLGWIGLELLASLTNTVTRVYLGNRKMAVLPVSTVSYNGDTLTNLIAASLMGSGGSEKDEKAAAASGLGQYL